MNAIRRYPIIGASLAQLLAALIVIGLMMAFTGPIRAGIDAVGQSSFLPANWQSTMVQSAPLAWIWLRLILQGIVAAALSRAFGLPIWWVWIGLAFPIALTLALNAGQLSAWPFAIGFVILFLLFSNTAAERVPLYLSNAKTIKAMCVMMGERKATRFIDLGSGLGGMVRAMDGRGRIALGVETAPMVWLVSVLLSWITGRGTILRRDIWSVDLSTQDVVYAFLSPEPMTRLYEKVRREMKPGSVLVSNSFTVPDIKPDEIWSLPDRRKTELFLYVMPGGT